MKTKIDSSRQLSDIFFVCYCSVRMNSKKKYSSFVMDNYSLFFFCFRDLNCKYYFVYVTYTKDFLFFFLERKEKFFSKTHRQIHADRQSNDSFVLLIIIDDNNLDLVFVFFCFEMEMIHKIFFF